LEGYAQWLTEAGLSISVAQQRDHHLRNMVESIRARLLMADVMRGLGKLDIPGLDIAKANQFARAASTAIQAGQLGYGVLVACKPLQAVNTPSVGG
jgi:hypothetical protein